MNSPLRKGKKSRYVNASSVGSVTRCPTMYCYNERNIQTNESQYAQSRGDRMHKELASEASKSQSGWFVRLLRWLFGWL